MDRRRPRRKHEALRAPPVRHAARRADDGISHRVHARRAAVWPARRHPVAQPLARSRRRHLERRDRARGAGRELRRIIRRPRHSRNRRGGVRNHLARAARRLLSPTATRTRVRGVLCRHPRRIRPGIHRRRAGRPLFRMASGVLRRRRARPRAGRIGVAALRPPARQPGHIRGSASRTSSRRIPHTYSQPAIPAHGPGLCGVHVRYRCTSVLDADLFGARARHPQSACDGAIRGDCRRHGIPGHISGRVARRPPVDGFTAGILVALRNGHAPRGAAHTRGSGGAATLHLLVGDHRSGAVSVRVDGTGQFRARQRGLSPHPCHRRRPEHLHNSHPRRCALTVCGRHDIGCALVR